MKRTQAVLLLRPMFLAIVGSFCLGFFSGEASAKSNEFLIIKNINVVDVIEGKILPSQNVVIEGSKVSYVGRSMPRRIPSNTKTIDGSRKYLSPGLWDMHFHLCWRDENDKLLFPILLKNGISGIRDMGGDTNLLRKYKVAVTAGGIDGPDIFGAGPMLDGDPPVYRDFSIAVNDKTDIATVLDGLRAGGVDFFKTYSLIREKQLSEIAAYCLKHDIGFAGHLSEYIEPEVSISLGQRSVEHLNRLKEIWAADRDRISRLGDLMASKKTFFCPTLITYQLKSRVRDPSVVNDDYSMYIPSSLMDEWKAVWAKRIERHTKNGDWDQLESKFRSQKELVGFLHKKGVLLLAGSDFAGMPYVYPGISLHQELALLVAAGLSNSEVLRTATINPAIYMAASKLHGSISAGKYADLLILERDPLKDIGNLKGIESVILKGKMVTR